MIYVNETLVILVFWKFYPSISNVRLSFKNMFFLNIKGKYIIHHKCLISKNIRDIPGF